MNWMLLILIFLFGVIPVLATISLLVLMLTKKKSPGNDFWHGPGSDAGDY